MRCGSHTLNTTPVNGLCVVYGQEEGMLKATIKLRIGFSLKQREASVMALVSERNVFATGNAKEHSSLIHCVLGFRKIIDSHDSFADY